MKSPSGECPSTYKGYRSPRDHSSDKFASAFNRAQECTHPCGFFGKAWHSVKFWEDEVAIGIANQFNPLIHAALQKKKDRGVYEMGKDEKNTA